MKEGEKIILFGSEYLVEKTYRLSDEEMKKHDLIHRNRVTLRKLSGENGLYKMDFANTQDAEKARTAIQA